MSPQDELEWEARKRRIDPKLNASGWPLQRGNKSDDARAMFRGFLRLSDSEPSSIVRDQFTKQNDLDELRASARLFLSSGVVPLV
jgi:hypothetical protein